MIETLIALGIGGLLTKLIDFLKTKTNLGGLELVGLLSIAVGILYALFVTFVPTEAQTSILGFVGIVMSTAVSVHEIIKRIKDTK